MKNRMSTTTLIVTGLVILLSTALTAQRPVNINVYSDTAKEDKEVYVDASTTNQPKTSSGNQKKNGKGKINHEYRKPNVEQRWVNKNQPSQSNKDCHRERKEPECHRNQYKEHTDYGYSDRIKPARSAKSCGKK
ncbi:MAG: hypothetical protein KA143_11395 [Saprospiraceae bacterium]|nr:hypothetical protein [Saprospiraceae bacterium]